MSLTKHTAANLLGTLLPVVVSLATVPLFLRYVGVERFGILAVVWALLAYFTLFDFGLGRAVAQRLSRHAQMDERLRSDVLWTAICAAIVMAIAGSALLIFLTDLYLMRFASLSDRSRAEAASAMPWLAGALPFVLMISVLRGALTARLRFVEINVVDVVSAVLTQVLPLAAAASGFVELGVLVPAALASRVVSVAILFRLCRTGIPLTGGPRVSWTHLRALAQYGGWITLMSLVVPLLVTGDRLLIGAVLGASFVAFYTIPYDVVTKVMTITTSVSTALFPRLASASDADAKDLATRATATLMGIMTPVVLAGILLVHPFLQIWIGREFAEHSRGVAEVILLGVWLNAAVAAHQSRMLGADNPRTVVLLYVVEMPVYFAALWFGLQAWGLIGAAGAWTLRVALDTILLLYFARSMAAVLKMMAIPLLLIAASLWTALGTDSTSITRWVLAISLMLACLFRERNHLLFICRAVLRLGPPAPGTAEARSALP